MDENEIKLEKTVLDKIQNIISTYNQLIVDLGSAEVELLRLQNVKATTVDKLNALQQQESELYTNLHETLGVGEINIEKGVFIPQKSDV